MSEQELNGRVALVTGGSRGIGRACCEVIAAAGGDVAVNYHSNEQAAEETARLIEAAGRRAITVRADVSSEEQVAQMVADVEQRLGPIDLLVNMASFAALRARPLSIAYAVSKAGVVALTKSLSAAVAARNIRVNAVAPGLIETDILDGVDQAKLDALIEATPIQRIGRPDEIAPLVLFLLTEKSSFMTGQTLVASGGRVLLP